MISIERVYIWIAEFIPLFAALAAFVYGIRVFFKKGKPLYSQSITMAMGCHVLGSLFHVCQTFTAEIRFQGFTPAYLGRIGFFLFFVAGSYGQMDRIVDDGSDAVKSSRYLAMLAPLLAFLLYLPNAWLPTVSLSKKIAYLLVWIPGAVSMYFSLKHAIIPDLDFGFVKAIKPYNMFAVCLGFSELLSLTVWNFGNGFLMAFFAIVFGVLCIATMVAMKKGVEKWTI